MTALPQAIEPAEFPWYDYSGYTFSLGLKLGDDVLNSGHSGSAFDPAKGKPDVAGGMGEQARTAYAKQEAILAAAGLTFADVTRVVENISIAGLPDYAEAQDVRAAVFGEHRPTVATVIVDRLVRRKALIEVEVHASLGGGQALVLGSDGGCPSTPTARSSPPATWSASTSTSWSGPANCCRQPGWTCRTWCRRSTTPRRRPASATRRRAGRGRTCSVRCTPVRRAS
jgi:enamine deaminase RidA (YjgF/YER057c/UK114 family)